MPTANHIPRSVVDISKHCHTSHSLVFGTYRLVSIRLVVYGELYLTPRAAKIATCQKVVEQRLTDTCDSLISVWLCGEIIMLDCSC